MASDRDVWLRQPRERGEQHEAFVVYARSDSLERVAEETGVPLRTLTRWSSAWGWYARRAAFLEHTHKRDLDQAEQERAKAAVAARKRQSRRAELGDQHAEADFAEMDPVNRQKLAAADDARLTTPAAGPGAGAGPGAMSLTVNVGQIESRVDARLAELESDLAAILEPDQWALLRARRDARRNDSNVVAGEVIR